MSHHPLPPNPSTYLPARPASRSPSRENLERQAEDRPGFSRAGFAPIPHRHSEVHSPSRDGYARGPPPPGRFDEPIRGGRERDFPRRDLDPIYDDDRWDRREDWERRGRGREDPTDRPKRLRSPSPPFAARRPRMHSPSPPRGAQNNLPDPATIPELLNFRDFANWFRASHPNTAKADEEELKRVREALENGTADAKMSKERVGMGKRYERYRKEYTSRQLYAMYLTHRDSEWFKDRYSSEPAAVAQRRRVNRQGRVRTAEKYLDQLRAGEHDTVSFDMNSEGKRPGNLTDVEEPEGLDRALGDAPVYDESRIEISPKANSVFIKTVPPNATRKSLEELFAKHDGFQYLALTEPAMKKGFHRVGWAQFADGVDVAEVVKSLDESNVDGFTYHITVNSTPSIGKIRITAPVANTLERLEVDGQKAKLLALKIEEELVGDDDEGEASRGLNEKATDFVQETIDRIIDQEGLGGDDVSDEGKLRKAKVVADHWISFLRTGLSTCYYCVAPMAFSEELHRKCIAHFRPSPTDKPADALESVQEANEEIPKETEGATNGRGDHDEEDGDKRDADDTRVEEAERIRDAKRASFPSKSSDEKWEETLDLKLQPLLETVNPVEFGGKDIEEETKRLTAPLIKQEEASKYRCKECNKLFKAPEFVMKHISTKHGELIQPKLDEYAYFNSFVLDPQHLQPTKEVPAAVNDKLPSSQPSMPLPMFNPTFGPDVGNMGRNMGQPAFNVMQQQMMMMMQMQQAMMMAGGMNGAASGLGGAERVGPSGRDLGARMGGFADTPVGGGPPPGGEDPRAKRGRVSYQDLDEVGGGDSGGLPY
ncbi:hypothetical protein BCR39DRAFT_528324 [Naematelia encephala]|uniref:C2H2-type domain-containing protein n=1 Tax=Naematelia encephala TaxID=71784 RepID=A0A1Y2B7G8_9TREE|nr:hypothetical protein BCR39DRAFT_528324 [Naematelia encephala]